MFGQTIDYWLLKPLAHSRDIATEEELDAIALQPRPLDVDHAMARLDKWNARLGDAIPFRDDWTYLDVGCGRGDITLALAMKGKMRVTGVDFVERNIDFANGYAQQTGLADRVDFQLANINSWEPEEKYDVALSHEALEHIEQPWIFLEQLRKIVKPGGLAIFAFGPLFYSPFGDHMNFFRLKIPWKGVLFNEQAILKLRAEHLRPTDPADRYEDIKEGLNRMRYSDFMKYVEDTGWEVESIVLNAALKKIPPAYWFFSLMTRIPGVRNYFAASVHTILRSRKP